MNMNKKVCQELIRCYEYLIQQEIYHLDIIYISYDKFEEYLIETNQVYITGKLPTFLGYEMVPIFDVSNYINFTKKGTLFNGNKSDEFYRNESIKKLNKIYLRDQKLKELGI